MLALLGLTALVSIGGLAAQEPPATAAEAAAASTTVPLRVVGGKLVLNCELSTPTRRIPANVFIEPDTDTAFQLHGQAARALRPGPGAPVTIHLPGFDVVTPSAAGADDRFLSDYTKRYSAEIAEVGVVAVVGMKLLAEYLVTFDLATESLQLSTPRARSPEPVSGDETTIVVPFTMERDRVFLPARLPGGVPGAVALGGSRYDTVANQKTLNDRSVRDARGFELRIEEHEVHAFVPFRRERVSLKHPDGVFGVLGINWLEHVEVELDFTNRRATLRESKAASDFTADSDFLHAIAEREEALLQAGLEDYAGTRLCEEASRLLLQLRLTRRASDDDVQFALNSLGVALPSDLRTTELVSVMDQLASFSRLDMVLFTGEMAIESGREDRYPEAVHQAHATLGRIHLDQGDLDTSWKHLLSAAFGMPEDGPNNYQLGRLYEEQGRYKRAFSRYVQAVIQPDSGPDALRALESLQQKMEPGQALSIEQVERLTAGKVQSFGTATEFEPNDENSTDRVTLVEFFTNANFGDNLRGSVGGSLGNEGLLDHFSTGHVVFVSYHLPVPALDPLCNEVATTAADRYGVGPDCHVIDGDKAGPGAGNWRQKNEIYEANRELVLDALKKSSGYSLDLSGAVEDGRVAGRVEVSGPESTKLSIEVLLTERGVVYPGRSQILIHRHVARASLVGPPRGQKVVFEDGRMDVSFDESLSELSDQNERFLDDLMFSGAGTVEKVSIDFDTRELSLVAILRNRFSEEVLQVATIDL